MATTFSSATARKAAILLCALSVLPSTAWAATFYVEKFGDDSNDCRSLATPCETIQQAVLKGIGRDTVIVGIGIFEEAVVVERFGVKLISRAGYSGTTIDASSQPGEPALTVLANNVKVGQRRRGFMLRTDSMSTALHVLANVVTVEGNKLEADNAPNGAAALIQGDRAVIRFNLFKAGLRLEWIDPNAVSIRNALIADNVLTSGSISIMSTAESNRNRVQRNQLHSGGLNTFNMQPGGAFGPWLTNTKDQYVGNELGAGVYMQGGSSTFDGNVVTDFFVLDSKNSTLRRNKVVTHEGARDYGMLIVQDSTNVSVLNNTISGHRYSVLFESYNGVKAFRNNNLWDFIDCPLDVNESNPPRPIRMTGNFWGAPGAPDLSCGDGDILVADGDLSFAPRNQPNNY